jgi:hypothetical protein
MVKPGREERPGKAGASAPPTARGTSTKPTGTATAKKTSAKTSGVDGSANPSESKGIYHMKKALKKKLALVEKYKELKESGKLEDFMAKRRKKMMLRDHTLFPRARNAA